MANQWFRMYHEFATDPKVQMLSEVNQRRFIMLLCLRCSNEEVTLHDEEVAFQLRISNEEYTQTKQLLVDRGLIDSDNKPTAWERRQFVSDSSAARVARHREKKKRERNVTETKSNALDTDTDTDTDTDKSSSEKNPGRAKGKKIKFSDDDLLAAQYMLKGILTAQPDYKKPNIEKWAEVIRLMRERDNRTHREICEVWAWARRDSFWAPNILSPAKLREKYDQLKAKMVANHGSHQQHRVSGIDPNDTSWISGIESSFFERMGGDTDQQPDDPIDSDLPRVDGSGENTGTTG